jgi:two-component system response regulator LytT
LAEHGFELSEDKLCIVFDGIDYMEVVKLLVSGLSKERHLKNTVTGFSKNRFTVIEPQEILYLETGSECIMALTLKDQYAMKETLQYYEHAWVEKGFIRINKSNWLIFCM